MAISYYACDGTVTNQSGRLRCSTTWQTYTPPSATSNSTMTVSGELLTASDTLQLFGAVFLLVAMGYQRRDIADLSFVTPDVVSNWLNHWESDGLSGLYDAPRHGRPPIYTKSDGVHLKAFLDESPQQLRQAQAQLTELTGKSSSLDTVKRLLKKTPTIVGNAVVAR